MAALKIVLDTNVLLSGIAFPASIPGKILAAWRHGSIDVVSSDFILDELRRVLPRLSHRHCLSDTEMDDLVDSLAIQAELVDIKAIHEHSLRDANDLPVLATLIEALTIANAHYLVSGDKDLLVLAARYPVISPADFWSRHGGL